LANVSLYKYYGDFNQNGRIDPEERELIGSEILPVTPNIQNLQNIEVELEPVDSSMDHIALEDDQLYLVAVHWTPALPTGPIAPMLSMTTHLLDGYTEIFNTERVREVISNMGMERMSTVAMSGDGFFDEEERSLIPLNFKELYLELDIERRSNIVDPDDDDEKIDEEEEEVEKKVVHLYPNPTDQLIVLELDSVFLKTNVTIEVLNQDGSRNMRLNYPNLETGRIEIQIPELLTGLYYISISNGEQRVTKRVSVLKE